ncbi:hypothetical protein SAMN05444372_108108 [Flavobacterium micromati]|uniref:Uncharacterized protein n=1 Tax=Flavobacterium micromati TaxID=229205 RepID=A0A1M5LLF2_9FLAO|nr:hypothetical protein [Flavobacterium micromati]SHG65364.1 hypothetical protein SAMN05444372_108103 [Flavobacterium micromati]SHG65509.1 hypothetical protein SAMN05444372_108108 [Flavobacterium micromati]
MTIIDKITFVLLLQFFFHLVKELGEWILKTGLKDAIIGKSIVALLKDSKIMKDGSLIKLYYENGTPKTIR